MRTYFWCVFLSHQSAAASATDSVLFHMVHYFSPQHILNHLSSTFFFAKEYKSVDSPVKLVDFGLSVDMNVSGCYYACAHDQPSISLSICILPGSPFFFKIAIFSTLSCLKNLLTLRLLACLTSQDGLLAYDVVGTWLYMAPEVILGSHIPAPCDMWSIGKLAAASFIQVVSGRAPITRCLLCIGVITYLLLCGRPPFNGNTVEELKYQIRHGKYRFSGPAWAIISAQAKNFIKRLLVRNLVVSDEKNRLELNLVEGR